MSALTFDKNELGNLEYSLQREMLSTDRMGGYMSTTIVGCNLRRYHGLMVAPIAGSEQTYVLLSSLDETLVQDGQAFNLAIHRFRGLYEPRGHKYITDFAYTPVPTITYRVGSAVLRKELLWIHKRTQLMIRYTLVEAPAPTTLRLRPFFAYREKEALTHANMEANGRSYPVLNGVRNRLYEGYPWLYLQLDRADAEFVAAPDWYYGFEYPKELQRGYDGYEDLLTTGYFETTLAKGESLIFSASTEEMHSSEEIDETFSRSIARRNHKLDFRSMLQHAARQFVIRRPDGRTEIVAGYPWLTAQIGREAFASLPGITLEQHHKEDMLDVLDSLVGGMRDGDFAGSASAREEADAPLWFFYALQELEPEIGRKAVWQRYGKAMKAILEAYRRGIGHTVRLHDNGLVWAADFDRALTWMNSYVEGHPVTERYGYQVEANALWYNAVCYALELAREAKDTTFVGAWKEMPARTRAAFLDLFWSEEEGYLADYANDREVNRQIRPNALIACGLEYTMLDDAQIIDILRTVNQHLLTPKGLRTLSPLDLAYNGTYDGDDRMRAYAAMNGTVWVWLLPFYVRANYRVSGTDYTASVEGLIDNFEEDIQSHGIGSIAKMYDADPPYTPRSAISYAWSVGAVLQLYRLMERFGTPVARKRSAGSAATAPTAEAAPKQRSVKTSRSAAAAKSAAKSAGNASDPAAPKSAAKPKRGVKAAKTAARTVRKTANTK